MLFPVCLFSCAACNATHKTQARGKKTAVRQREVDFLISFPIIQPRFEVYHAALLVQGKFQNLADLNARVRRVFSGKSVRLDVGALSMWWHESQGEIERGGGGVGGPWGVKGG